MHIDRNLPPKSDNLIFDELNILTEIFLYGVANRSFKLSGF